MTFPLIAPSILSADPLRLGEEVAALEAAGADWIHVDVMDGHFVPNLTFGPHVVRHLRRATRLPLDVHLMVQHPAQWVGPFAEAGADSLTIHPEADPHIHRTLGLIRSLGKKAGIALNPGTSHSVIEPLLDSIDLILVMTVNPGFGGQRFLADQRGKLARVRDLIGQRPIHLEVDGGITPTTAPDVVACGAQILVAGSAILDGSAAVATYRNAIQALRSGTL